MKVLTCRCKSQALLRARLFASLELTNEYKEGQVFGIGDQTCLMSTGIWGSSEDARTMYIIAALQDSFQSKSIGIVEPHFVHHLCTNS